MKAGNANYEKVAEIDEAVIFADKDGYFLIDESQPLKEQLGEEKIRTMLQNEQ